MGSSKMLNWVVGAWIVVLRLRECNFADAVKTDEDVMDAMLHRPIFHNFLVPHDPARKDFRWETLHSSVEEDGGCVEDGGFERQVERATEGEEKDPLRNKFSAVLAKAVALYKEEEEERRQLQQHQQQQQLQQLHLQQQDLLQEHLQLQQLQEQQQRQLGPLLLQQQQVLQQLQRLQQRQLQRLQLQRQLQPQLQPQLQVQQQQVQLLQLQVQQQQQQQRRHENLQQEQQVQQEVQQQLQQQQLNPIPMPRMMYIYLWKRSDPAGSWLGGYTWVFNIQGKSSVVEKLVEDGESRVFQRALKDGKFRTEVLLPPLTGFCRGFHETPSNDQYGLIPDNAARFAMMAVPPPATKIRREVLLDSWQTQPQEDLMQILFDFIHNGTRGGAIDLSNQI